MPTSKQGIKEKDTRSASEAQLPADAATRKMMTVFFKRRSMPLVAAGEVRGLLACTCQHARWSGKCAAGRLAVLDVSKKLHQAAHTEQQQARSSSHQGHHTRILNTWTRVAEPSTSCKFRILCLQIWRLLQQVPRTHDGTKQFWTVMLLFHDRTHTEKLKNRVTSNIRTCRHDVKLGDLGQWSEYKIPKERARHLLIRFACGLKFQMSGFVFRIRRCLETCTLRWEGVDMIHMFSSHSAHREA